MVATTTGDFPKIIFTQSGKESSAPEACVIPMPKATERPTMEEFPEIHGLTEDQLDSCHGNGGEDGNGGASQHTLGNGGQKSGEFWEKPQRS